MLETPIDLLFIFVILCSIILLTFLMVGVVNKQCRSKKHQYSKSNRTEEFSYDSEMVEQT